MIVRLHEVITALKRKNYKIFGDLFELNIVGIRSADMTPNIFNDKLIAFCKDVDSPDYKEKIWTITTDPGLYYLRNPLNIEGTAILYPGQYLNTYKLDLHQGKYLALCQRLGKVKVYRDANKDDRYDTEETATGMFGINIHKAGADSSQVNKWSAGCQVFQKEKEFNEFIVLCKKHRAVHGNKFTYTLLTEADLINIPDPKGIDNATIQD